jgi:hypothetical protein
MRNAHYHQNTSYTRVKNEMKKEMNDKSSKMNVFRETSICQLCYPSITYYWTGLLMLDHSHLDGNLTNSKIAEPKPLEPDIFVSSIFELVNIPTRYE